VVGLVPEGFDLITEKEKIGKFLLAIELIPRILMKECVQKYRGVRPKTFLRGF
jgi:hypothetical protein